MEYLYSIPSRHLYSEAFDALTYVMLNVVMNK